MLAYNNNLIYIQSFTFLNVYCVRNIFLNFGLWNLPCEYLYFCLDKATEMRSGITRGHIRLGAADARGGVRFNAYINKYCKTIKFLLEFQQHKYKSNCG